MVCVQLIDLGEVAIPANSPKESLRLLLAIQKDGAEIRLPGSKSTLEGDFAGCVENEGQWKDGELHLMNLFVKTEDGLTTFDVVVVCSEPAPDAQDEERNVRHAVAAKFACRRAKRLSPLFAAAMGFFPDHRVKCWKYAKSPGSARLNFRR